MTEVTATAASAAVRQQPNNIIRNNR